MALADPRPRGPPRRPRPGRVASRPLAWRSLARDLGAGRHGRFRRSRALAGLGWFPRPPRPVAGRGVHHGRVRIRLHARKWLSGEPRPALDDPSVVERDPRRGLPATLPVVLRAGLPARVAPRENGALRPRRHRCVRGGGLRPLPFEPGRRRGRSTDLATTRVERPASRPRVPRLLGRDRRPRGARPARVLPACPIGRPERAPARETLRPQPHAGSRAPVPRGPGRGPHPPLPPVDGRSLGQRGRLPDPLPAVLVDSPRHRPRRRRGPPPGRATTPRARRPLPAGADHALPADDDAARHLGPVPVRAAHRAVGGPGLGSRGVAAAEHGGGGVPASRLARSA